MTATPRHDNGAIFVQTVCDYPLVEAIAAERGQASGPARCGQPRQAARAQERRSSPRNTPTTSHLGVEEWRKSYAEHEKLGKKAVLFVMVDDTRNCDEVGAYLEKICPELQGAVLVIHTKNNGEISEAASGKNKEELETAAQAVERDRHLEIAIQGDRLGADAQGGLGRAQRHHHRRPARLRGQEQHSARADPGARLAPDVFRQRASARPSRSWARPPSWTSSNPSRAKASRSSACRWAGQAGARARIR